MSEIELQVQHDSTHRKPAVDDFEIPGLSLKLKGNEARESTREVKIDSQADASAIFAPSKTQVRTARFQFLTLCWTLFLAGWNDASTGPLLPRIQQVYHVRFS
jgi:hypothetical protein